MDQQHDEACVQEQGEEELARDSGLERSHGSVQLLFCGPPQHRLEGGVDEHDAGCGDEDEDLSEHK